MPEPRSVAVIGASARPDGAPWITGRRAERDRAGGSRDPRGRTLPPPHVVVREPQHGGCGRRRRALVHRPEWHLRAGRARDRPGRVFDAPRGEGPCGITSTPSGTVWLSSLAGSYIARVRTDGRLSVIDVPTPGGRGPADLERLARAAVGDRVVRGEAGTVRPVERGVGRVGPPGSGPQPYAVFVDHRDVVWVTDLTANALVRFEAGTEQFRSFRFPTPGAESGSCSDGPARCGAPSPGPIGSWCCGPAGS